MGLVSLSLIINDVFSGIFIFSSFLGGEDRYLLAKCSYFFYSSLEFKDTYEYCLLSFVTIYCSLVLLSIDGSKGYRDSGMVAAFLRELENLNCSYPFEGSCSSKAFTSF